MPAKRVVLISGANRGIGAETARLSEQSGMVRCRSACASPHLAGLGRFRPRQSSFRTMPMILKVRNPWVEASIATFGRIDAIIANAGHHDPKNSHRGRRRRSSTDTMTVNVKAPRRLAKPRLGNSARPSGRGRVIILGSLSGKRVKSADCRALFDVQVRRSGTGAWHPPHGLGSRHSRHRGLPWICRQLTWRAASTSRTDDQMTDPARSRPYHCHAARPAERGERRRIHHQLPA